MKITFLISLFALFLSSTATAVAQNTSVPPLQVMNAMAMAPYGTAVVTTANVADPLGTRGAAAVLVTYAETTWNPAGGTTSASDTLATLLDDKVLVLLTAVIVLLLGGCIVAGVRVLR